MRKRDKADMSLLFCCCKLVSQPSGCGLCDPWMLVPLGLALWCRCQGCVSGNCHLLCKQSKPTAPQHTEICMPEALFHQQNADVHHISLCGWWCSGKCLGCEYCGAASVGFHERSCKCKWHVMSIAADHSVLRAVNNSCISGWAVEWGISGCARLGLQDLHLLSPGHL